MLKRIAGAAVGAAALMVLVVPHALAGSATDRAQGGGQILVSSDGHGPGSTIAFTANAGNTPAGQIQLVDRSGASQVVQHGTVDCVDATDNTAKLAGHWANGDGFTMVVEDNGPASSADNDMIALQNSDDPTCKRENGDDNGSTDLSRGNVTVYDAG